MLTVSDGPLQALKVFCVSPYHQNVAADARYDNEHTPELSVGFEFAYVVQRSARCHTFNFGKFLPAAVFQFSVFVRYDNDSTRAASACGDNGTFQAAGFVCGGGLFAWFAVHVFKGSGRGLVLCVGRGGLNGRYQV